MVAQKNMHVNAELFSNCCWLMHAFVDGSHLESVINAPDSVVYH